LIFLNNHLTDYYTMTYCLKRKNKKRFFSFQSMPNLNCAELIVYLYHIRCLLVKANSLNRSRRRINHRLTDRKKTHPAVHTFPRNDGQGLHLTAMFHPAAPEFEGSFVE
jgi:hypothetical protein